MKYCSIDDVVALIQNITISDSSRPSSAQVEEWITGVSEREVDPVLSVVTPVPVSNPMGQGYLQGIVAHRVAAMILLSLEAEPEKVREFQAVFRDGLKAAAHDPGIVSGGFKARSGVKHGFGTREVKYQREARDW